MKFTMTNNGSGAVAILSARASCGCTEPSFPRKPVAPGEEAVVNVGFNTTGQRGEIDKEVTLEPLEDGNADPVRGVYGQETEKQLLAYMDSVLRKK